MAKRNQLLNEDEITAYTGKDRTFSETVGLKNCALEIAVRTEGKSKRAYLRYNGTPFGEKRTERHPIGPFSDGLYLLRKRARDGDELIEQGKSPQRHLARKLEEQRAAGMTFGAALDEFWAHAEKKLWNEDVAKYNNRMRRNHLEPMIYKDTKLIDMVLTDIDADVLKELLDEKWNTHAGVATRARSLIHSTIQFQIDKDKPIFRGANPASWSKKSSLSRKLGDPLPYNPLACVHYQDIPKVMAYFCAPQDHWVPGYLTTMQAAAAWKRSPKQINWACESNHGKDPQIKGIIPAPKIWKAQGNLIPIDELIRRYGPPLHEPVPHENESARLYVRVIRACMFAAVRTGQICNLRWRNIDWEQKLLIWKPKRKDPITGKMLPSEHKNGWKYNYPHIGILTDNLGAIFLAQREQNIHDGIPVEQDDFVFVHGKAFEWTSNDSWYKKQVIYRTLNDYLTRAVDRLREQGETIRIVPADAVRPVIGGLRGSTFSTWTKENGIRYSDDELNLTIGHIIPAIKENPTNRHYLHEVQMIAERTKMMRHWEQHLLSLVVPPSEQKEGGPTPQGVNLMDALRASIDAAEKKNAPAPSTQARRPAKKRASQK